MHSGSRIRTGKLWRDTVGPIGRMCKRRQDAIDHCSQTARLDDVLPALHNEAAELERVPHGRLLRCVANVGP